METRLTLAPTWNRSTEGRRGRLKEYSVGAEGRLSTNPGREELEN